MIGCGRLICVRYWLQRLAASDPGHARLTNTIAVTVAILLSTGAAWLIVDHDLADRGFFASAILLTVQLAMSASGSSPRDRLRTSIAALLPMVAAPTAAALLDHWRSAEIALFIVLAGVAVWLRRFGPRAGQLGTVAFLGYFYVLVLRPPLDQLPGYLLLMVCVTGAVILVRLVMLRERPAHQLSVLLSEMRAASAAALRAARSTGPRTDRRRLLSGHVRAIDAIARAIVAWQDRFPTAHTVDCTAHDLANAVLDARIDTEHAVLEIATLLHDGDGPGLALNKAINDLEQMLDEQTPDAQLAIVADRALNQRRAAAELLPESLASYLTARSTLAHYALRRIGPAHIASNGGDSNGGDSNGVDTARPPRDRDDPAAAPSAPAIPIPTVAPTTPPHPRWAFWRTWTSTTAMAVQAMTAAALATVIGDQINASRWYWAVMASFLIFVGATRRSVLTRAWHRIVGTVVAIGLGVAVSFAIHGPSYWHLVIGIAGVIGLFYLGPLSQIYSAFFLSLLAVSQYGLLGVLDHRLMMTRLEETVAGIIVGVACAYLVFSRDSGRTLTAAIGQYLDSVTALLQCLGPAMSGAGRSATVLDAARTVDRTQAALDDAAESMSALFVGGRRSRISELRHLMRVASRSAEHAAQSAIHVTDRPPGQQLSGPDAAIFDDAVECAISDIAVTRRILVDGDPPVRPDRSGAQVITAAADRLRAHAEAAPAHAALLVARLDDAVRAAR